MPKLPKAIYEQLSDEGKRIQVAQLKKEQSTASTKKVRANMATQIAKKVIAGIKKNNYKKTKKR